MLDLWFIGGLAAGATFLAGRAMFRKNDQQLAANASGLVPIHDLSDVPAALQRTALWALSDGGFERRVVHGRLARDAGDVEVTAFDLETLRDRRGEWAWLPVDQPFRIGDVVSVVVCELDRSFPHVLLKRSGTGDAVRDDPFLERVPLHPGDNRGAKLARDALGLGRAYAAELPAALPAEPLDVVLPANWRAYSQAKDLVDELTRAGLGAALEAASRRDLVVEMLESIVVVYPAARDVVGADAFADLTSTALTIADGVLAASRTVTPPLRS